MADLFELFDGSIGAGGQASVSNQTGDSFSAISSENDLVATLASGSDSIELLVDYSDFANFVTFNSAESYVTITADQILNSYPYDGTVDDLQVFLNSLDGYQRYFLENWPSYRGHLRLNPAISSSYVRVDDFGIDAGVARTSLMSPGTGSMTIQAWIDVPTLTGSSDVQVILQKQRDNGDGYTLFVTGSRVMFQVVSGSVTATASASLAQMPSFVAASLDRSASTGSLNIYVGTTGSYPTRADSAPIITGARFDLASGSFFIGSGSLTGKVVRPFTGSIDSVSAWSVARGLNDLSGTYNRKLFAQSGLIALWRFNDCTPISPNALGSIARDSSGHRLDGRIQRFFSGSRGSGSLTNDSSDPILSLDDPQVVMYVVAAQVTGALYDRNNPSQIFNLFPDAFSQADQASADVFRNFTLILARHYDRIKLYVNQLVNLRRVTYGDFDQAPDELLEEVGRFMGWDMAGSFATTDALRYFVGRNVQAGPTGNAGLSTQMSDIKAQFWRRILLNLMYLYKTKGTRESVEALLRSYGVNNGFVRLKEYARKAEARVPVARVVAEKSFYALRFDAGSIKFGTTPGTGSTPPLTVAKTMIAIMGQSNATAHAAANTLSTASLADPYPNVQLYSHESFATAPLTWEEYSGSLDSITFNGVDSVGYDCTLGRDLDRAAAQKFSIVRIAVGGAASDDWDGYLSQAVTWTKQAMTASNSTQLAMVFSHGEADSKTSLLANAYKSWLTGFVSSYRSQLGSIGPGGTAVPVVIARVNNAITTGTYVFKDTIRYAQAQVVASGTYMTLADQDPVALSSDNVHYTADGYASLGHIFSPIFAQYVGVNIPPSASFDFSVTNGTASFIDTSAYFGHPITSWSWDLSGSTSTLQNPTKVFPQNGYYPISLQVTDSAGQTSTASKLAFISTLSVSKDATRNIYVPNSAAEWTTLLAANSNPVARPSSLWLCQDPVSSSLMDSIGNLHLTGAQSPSYQVAVAGWSRLGVSANAGSTTRFAAPAGTGPNPATQSSMWLWFIDPTAVPGAARQLAGIGGGSAATDASLAVTVSGTIRARCVNLTSDGTDNIVAGGARPFVIQYDRTNSIFRIMSDTEVVNGTYNSGVTDSLKGIFGGNGGNSAAATVIYGALWTGSYAEVTSGSVKSLLQGMGWTVTW